jgi:hypothetical protein
MCNNSKFMIWGKNKNINYHNQLGIFGCQLRITTCDGIVCLFLEARADWVVVIVVELLQCVLAITCREDALRMAECWAAGAYI